jgi:hypothetical protein
VNDSVEEASLNSRASTEDDFETYGEALRAEVEVAAVMVLSMGGPGTTIPVTALTKGTSRVIPDR